MRSSNSKIQENVETINPETPVENGLPSKEDDDEAVREVAAQVVDDVVKRASAVARERTVCSQSKNKGCNLQRLPTIQIDTVSSLPPSPEDWTPPDEFEEGPVEDSEVQLELDEQESGPSEEELREDLKSFVEELVSEAMVLAEKKLQFSGMSSEDAEHSETETGQSLSSPEPFAEQEKETDDSEIREAAEKVVEEVISKATETVEERLQNGIAGVHFPELPSFKIDTVISAPPSPEAEEDSPLPPRKWTFKVDEKEYRKKVVKLDGEGSLPGEPTLVAIAFDDAPDEVKEAATAFVKEIVGKAVAMAEERSVPTVPFNFEDPDMMKTNGPWYIRAREAFIRLLRTACFCTPRRADS